MDDRLQFNGAVFLEDWEDIQVSFHRPERNHDSRQWPGSRNQRNGNRADWLATDCAQDQRCGSLLRFRAEGRLQCHRRGWTTFPGQGTGGDPVAGNTGIQGQPALPATCFRWAVSRRTCRVRWLTRQPHVEPGHDRQCNRTAISRRARSWISRSASRTTSTRSSCSSQNAHGRGRSAVQDRRVRLPGLRCPELTASVRGRGRSASGSRRTSDPGRLPVERRGRREAPLLFQTFESGNDALRRFM